jgi:hypothetical protein
MGPAIAHTLVSFGFDDGSHVVFSLEIRKERGESFSALGGFFRKFEETLVAADERDILRVRTNARGEDMYLYRLDIPRDKLRELFLGYVQRAQALDRAPRFYNTLTSNCTTVVFELARRLDPGLPLDWRLLLSGYFAEYAYDQHALQPGYTFAQLQRARPRHRACTRPATPPTFPRASAPACRRTAHRMNLECRDAGAGKARGGVFRLGACLLAFTLLSGCAMVTVKSRGSADYIGHRGDVLSTGALSQSGRETLGVAGLEEKTCRQDIQACVKQLDAIPELDGERRLSAESELWVAQAQATAKANPSESLDAWLHAARSAYAYLFYTSRTPGERAFENRQTQVRDYYNYAVGQVGGTLFQRWHAALEQGEPVNTLVVGDWTGRGHGRVPPARRCAPARVAGGGRCAALRRRAQRVPARRFRRRIRGQGVATGGGRPQRSGETQARFRRGRSGQPQCAGFQRDALCAGDAVAQVRGRFFASGGRGHTVRVMPYDPYRQMVVSLHAQRVPLAGNFTAPYGLWLAESGFAAQSLRSLLGMERGIDRPHLYLMQPFDPNRRILLMLHGLASSPEAWVNLANEIMGDEALRSITRSGRSITRPMPPSRSIAPGLPSWSSRRWRVSTLRARHPLRGTWCWSATAWAG